MFHDHDDISPGAAGRWRTPSAAGSGRAGFGVLRAVPQERVGRCIDLKTWAQTAKPGEMIAYSRGPIMAQGCSTMLREYVGVLCEKGFVTAHMMRDAGEAVYVVQRTRTPILPGQL